MFLFFLKGAAKLGVDDSVAIEIALEEDGTIIDDDEVLEEFQPKTLMLLTAGEMWGAPMLSDLGHISPSTALSSSLTEASLLSDHGSCAIGAVTNDLSNDEQCPNVHDHGDEPKSGSKGEFSSSLYVPIYTTL